MRHAWVRAFPSARSDLWPKCSTLIENLRRLSSSCLELAMSLMEMSRLRMGRHCHIAQPPVSFPINGGVEHGRSANLHRCQRPPSVPEGISGFTPVESR
jgi:hypothetical protein